MLIPLPDLDRRWGPGRRVSCVMRWCVASALPPAASREAQSPLRRSQIEKQTLVVSAGFFDSIGSYCQSLLSATYPLSNPQAVAGQPSRRRWGHPSQCDATQTECQLEAVDIDESAIVQVMTKRCRGAIVVLVV